MTLKDFHVLETVYWFVNNLWYTFYISTAERSPGSDSCLKLDSEISFHLWSVFALLGLHGSCFWHLACIQRCCLILNQCSSSVLLRGQGLLGACKSKITFFFFMGSDYCEPSVPAREGRGPKDLFSGSLIYKRWHGGRHASRVFTEKTEFSLPGAKVEDLATLPSRWQPYRQTKWHVQASSLVYLWDYFSLCPRPLSPVG